MRRAQELGKGLSKRDKWEMIKLNIIGDSQQYSNERARNRKLIISQLEEKINKYEEKRDAQNLSQTEENLYLRTKNDFNAFLDEKAQGAIFRSGQAYYSLGEKSTKYFFNLEKAKSSAKGMNAILEGTEIIRDPSAIRAKQYEYYKSLYTSDKNVEFKYENNSDKKLSEHQRNSLEGEITSNELSKAISQMKRGKAPGCDGIITEFYMMNYRYIKDDLLDAINEGYREGKLHESALRGIISLIPKKGQDTRKLNCLRPISLLNCDYKFVEKCLANRLRPVLNEIIDEDQKGFLAGRNISCNIRRVLDTIQHTDSEELDGLIIQIDFMKCFDRVEIHALIDAMKYFEFGDSFIKWTKMIYNQPQACVTNNGYFTPWFQVSRSVKQGGPCSAYFFLILAEVLAIEIRKNPNIKGFMVNEILKLFGQYADDIDLYIKANKASLEATLNTFAKFENNSGFRINYEKTTIYRIGSFKDSNAKFYTEKQLNWTNDPINVLGVDVTNDYTQLCKINYTSIIKKAENTLQKWKSRNLSLFGKIMIVNSLVMSLFVYKMSVLPTIPNEIVTKLHKNCRKIYLE